MMKYFFGKKKEVTEQATVPNALQNTREASETLEKRLKFVEKKIAIQDEEARKRLKVKDQRGALMALKRKKMHTTELEQLEAARLTLEQQILALETAQIQKVAVSALSSGVQAQKNMAQALKIDKIDELVDDMQEQQDLQAEISQAISQGSPILDDDELLKELEGLQAEDIASQLDSMGKVPVGGLTLPEEAVTTPQQDTFSDIKANEISDQDRLNQLMGSLA